MSYHIYKGALTNKEMQAFMRRLESTWKKQQKVKHMNRQFKGHVVSGGPVTMKEAREAGLIKGEPKEATPEEHAEAIRTMEEIEETVKRMRDDKQKNED